VTLYTNTKQHCRAEDCLASIWNDLPQEFIDKAILLFGKTKETCDFVLLQLADTLNTQFKYRERSWNVWSIYGKVVQSL